MDKKATLKINEKLKNISFSLGQNYKLIIILLIVALFIGAAIYVFKMFVEPRLNKNFVENREFDTTIQSSNDQNIADVYMFKVDWCPHCKTALPIWEEFSSEYQDKTIKNYKLNFILVDGESDPETTDKFNVEAYPTIKLVKENQIIEYDAKPNRDTLLEFLNSTL